MAQEYVAGFCFDTAGERVVLVRKAKPAWQAGLLNGVGGKVEPGESPADAMRREFLEEAGVDVVGWQAYAAVAGDWGRVDFFRVFVDEDVLAQVRTMEAEPVEVFDVDQLPQLAHVANLSWLVPLARYRRDTYAPVLAREQPA